MSLGAIQIFVLWLHSFEPKFFNLHKIQNVITLLESRCLLFATPYIVVSYVQVRGQITV